MSSLLAELRPDAKKRAELAKRRQEKEIETTKQKKVKALERKHHREAEKERIAKIEQHKRDAREERIVPATQSLKGMDRVIAVYLDGQQFRGDSHPKHSALIKFLAKGGDEGRDGFFDWDNKQWATRKYEHLLKLVDSGHWFPEGIPHNAHMQFIRAVEARLQLKKVREEEAEAEEAKKRGIRAAAGSAPSDGLTDAQRKELKEAAAKDRLFDPPTEKEFEEFHRLGLNPAMADVCTKWPNEVMGPCGGISAIGRVLRYVSLCSDEGSHKRREKRAVAYMNACITHNTLPKHDCWNVCSDD